MSRKPSTKAKPFTPFTAYDADTLIVEATKVAEARLSANRGSHTLNDPNQVRAFIKLVFAQLDQGREHFMVITLDARHRMLSHEVLFSGGVDGCDIHSSIVARAVLSVKTACAVILVHNHPSGHPEPSASDHAMTARIKQGLALFDIKVLDHFIVAGSVTTSFAERGWL